jgi:uncharacterized membrane protein
MTDQLDRTFSSDFRRFFLRGLVVLLPSVLTLWIVVKAYQFVDTAIAEPINRSVRITINQASPHWGPLQEQFEPSSARLHAEIADRAVERRLVDRERIRHQLRIEMLRQQQEEGTYNPDSPPVPTDDEVNERIAEHQDVIRALNYSSIRTELRQRQINDWWTARWYMNLIGLVIAIIAVYVVGRLLGGFFGRHIYRKLEAVLTSVPVFKQVYPYVKQVVDFLFSEEQPIKFNRVVVVEYPRKGIWSVGFLTGPTLRSIAEHSGQSVTIFIPSSPTPFTGYTITVPQEDVIEVPISVEEAIRFALSGGVLIPDHQQLNKADYDANLDGIVLKGEDGVPVTPGVKDRQGESEDDSASSKQTPGQGDRSKRSSNP